VAFVVTVYLYLTLNAHTEYICAQEEGSWVALLGEVEAKEYQGEQLVLTLADAKIWNAGNENQKEIEKENEIKISGILCYIEMESLMEEPRLGSTVAVEGKVSYFSEARNYGSFDARKYYQILGIDYRLFQAKILAQSSAYSRYHEALYRIRQHFEEIFERVLSEKDASIMKAMVLGSRSELDTDSKLLYQKSGIAHVFAISGLHITLLGMGLYRLLRKVWIPQAVAAVLTVGMMIAYGDMVGMSSSAYRAVFMFGMKLAAALFRRTYDMLTALAVAAVLILAEQPLYLYHAGFLLSFGAILGVGCLSEVVRPVSSHNGHLLIDKLQASLCGSLSIFLIHFPIMLCVYYEFPIYSFLLNLVIIPAMTFVMAGGILCLFFGSIPVAAGIGAAKLMGMSCHLLLSFFEWLCTVSLKLPFANWIVGKPDTWRICIFLIMVLFLYAAHHYGKRQSRSALCEDKGMHIGLPFQIRLIIIFVAVVFISHRTINGASITFVDVGQGDCIWIESEKGEHFLIDGGSTSEGKVGTYTIIPYLKYMGVSQLEAVFLTHLDSDHISGVIELLEGNSGITVKRMCISDSVIEDEAYVNIAGLCVMRRIPLYRLKTGDCIETESLCFDVMHPSDGYQASSRNAYSLVMKLTIKGRSEGSDFTALFTGDVEADGEQAVARELGRTVSCAGGIDIYKAAHHGSKYSNTKELLAAANPAFTIISCGEGNRYGHPHAEAVQNFNDIGSNILATMDSGAIMIKIKNGKYTVNTYKENIVKMR